MSERTAFIMLIMAIPFAVVSAFISGWNFGRAAELRQQIHKERTRNEQDDRTKSGD